MSILSLTITSIVNRKRIIPSKIKCLMKYHRIKFTPGGTEYNRKGIYLIIDISNPSPHNIGLNNFTFYNDNCEQLYIETGYQFKHIFLDNLVEARPFMGGSVVIKANEQIRLSFLIPQNRMNTLPTQDIALEFSGIYTNWKKVIINPFSHLKNPESTLKRFYINQNIENEINVPRNHQR